MRPNYAAWQIDPQQFFEQRTKRERVAFLARFGVLAPSSHNSQPWRFIVEDDALLVEPEPKRALPATDLGNRQLYISLGCALEAMSIAADAFGMAPETSYEDRAGNSMEIGIRARLRLRSAGPEKKLLTQPHRLFAIAKRATNRSPHTDKPLPVEMLGAVAREMQGRVRTQVVQERAGIEAVGDLVLEGGAIAMRDPLFRRELADYLIPNNSKSGLGMTGATVGMGLVLSWLVPKLLPRMNPRDKHRPEEVKLLKQQTTAFVVVSTAHDTPPDWLDAGRAYMRLALDAEMMGLSTNNLAAPVTPPQVRTKLASLAGGGFPQMCFRLGEAVKVMPHCPRLGADEVTSQAPVPISARATA